MYNDGNVFSHGWWGKGHVQPIHFFLGVMITTMIDWKCFLPILVIFSSAFRVIASSPLLSDLIQGVCNDITVFSEIYFWSLQCIVAIIATVNILMLIITAIIIIMSIVFTLFSGPDESAAVPVIDPANPSQDFSPPASPTWGKKGSQNWKIYLFQSAFNIGSAL